mgnify:CR=1 FL=1
MKEFWDERYSSTEFVFGKTPNEFLVSQYHRIKLGRVLCLAEGEGRNAVFLAGKGYDVTAVDQSKRGLEKTKALGREFGVEITTIEADLNDFQIESASWDGIISISAHLPPSLRKAIHQQVVSGLNWGGVLILEAYTEKQLEMPGVGGPPAHQKEMFMSLPELKAELTGLNFVVATETERQFDEGTRHQGLSAVVQVVAEYNGD